jgi:AcrR family transcriptional regulator
MESALGRDTRDRIIEVTEACLSEHGYHGTRLHEIAERVGIQKASLFHYFRSKDGLYRAVVSGVFRDMEDTIRRVLDADVDAPERLRMLVEAYIDLVAEHPERTRIFIRHSFGDVPIGLPMMESERLLGTVIGFVRDAQARHELAPAEPVVLVLSLIGAVAFLFTSAPAIAPGLLGDVHTTESIARIKAHAMDIIQRFLIEPMAQGAATRAAAAAG